MELQQEFAQQDAHLTAELHEEFFQCIRANNKARFKEMIGQNKALLAVRDRQGNTPFLFACLCGADLIIAWYNAHEPDSMQDVQNSAGETPIYAVMESGQSKAISQLLANRLIELDVKKVYRNHETLLLIASRQCPSNVLKILVNHGADVLEKNNQGRNALMLAAQSGRTDSVNFLLSLKAPALDINALDEAGRAALDLAAENGHGDVIASLIAAGAKITSESEHSGTSLHLAARKNYLQVLQLLIQQIRQADGNLDTPEKNHEATALHYAARGAYEAVVALVEAGANLEAQTKTGQTPLQIASKYDQLKIVNYLLDHKANVSEADAKKRQALHYAASVGATDVMSRLLGANAECDARDENQRTPLHVACMESGCAAAKLLVDSGADLLARDVEGKTPLHMACKQGDEELFAYLLSTTKVETHEYLNVRDKYQQTPLHWACYYDNRVAVRYLLGRLADANAKSDGDKTAVYVAIEQGKAELVALLYNLLHEKKNEFEKQQGFSWLHLAAKLGQDAVIKRLIQLGEDPDCTDAKGFTPLHYAVIAGKNTTATLLIKSGANHMIRANDKTAADLARDHHHESLVPVINQTVEEMTSQLRKLPAQMMRMIEQRVVPLEELVQNLQRRIDQALLVGSIAPLIQANPHDIGHDSENLGNQATAERVPAGLTPDSALPALVLPSQPSTQGTTNPPHDNATLPPPHVPPAPPAPPAPYIAKATGKNVPPTQPAKASNAPTKAFTPGAEKGQAANLGIFAQSPLLPLHTDPSLANKLVDIRGDVAPSDSGSDWDDDDREDIRHGKL